MKTIILAVLVIIANTQVGLSQITWIKCTAAKKYFYASSQTEKTINKPISFCYSSDVIGINIDGTTTILYVKDYQQRTSKEDHGAVQEEMHCSTDLYDDDIGNYVIRITHCNPARIEINQTRGTGDYYVFMTKDIPPIKAELNGKADNITSIPKNHIKRIENKGMEVVNGQQIWLIDTLYENLENPPVLLMHNLTLAQHVQQLADSFYKDGSCKGVFPLHIRVNKEGDSYVEFDWNTNSTSCNDIVGKLLGVLYTPELLYKPGTINGRPVISLIKDTVYLK